MGGSRVRYSLVKLRVCYAEDMASDAVPEGNASAIRCSNFCVAAKSEKWYSYLAHRSQSGLPFAGVNVPITRSNNARASGDGKHSAPGRIEMRPCTRTVVVVDVDQECQVPRHVFNVVRKHLQTSLEDVDGHHGSLGAVILHQSY